MMFHTYAKLTDTDLAGVGGTEPTPIKRQFASEAFEVGGQWTPGQWVLRSVAYTGRGIGQLFGDLSQFGDIKDTGAYVMGGYKFTSNWSAMPSSGWIRSVIAFGSSSRVCSRPNVRWGGRLN